MAATDTVAELAAPLVAAHGAAVYDVERKGDRLVVSVQRPDGVDLETISAITRALSAVLDEADPIGGSYTLEVSSPGLERKLRTVDHFVGALGEQVTIKARPVDGGPRRTAGELVAAGDDHIVVRDADTGDDRQISLDTIDSARTVFVWEKNPKPGKGGSTAARRPQSDPAPGGSES